MDGDATENPTGSREATVTLGAGEVPGPSFFRLVEDSYDAPPVSEVVQGGSRGVTIGSCWRPRALVVPFEYMAPPALKNPLKLSGGYVEMPEGPGLGVDLDMGIIESETTEVIQ